MKLLRSVIAFLSAANAVSSCADLAGQTVYMRVPWYARSFSVSDDEGRIQGLAFGTDTMQVSHVDIGT